MMTLPPDPAVVSPVAGSVTVEFTVRAVPFWASLRATLKVPLPPSMTLETTTVILLTG